MQLLRLFLVTIVVATSVSAQEPDFTVSIDARNVSVTATVVDATGRPVTKLTKDDFSIYEDGVLQEIQTFESVEVPYNILILVDCSASTEADWPLMGKAVDRFASKLRSQDRISVAQFGSKVETLMDWQPWTGDSFGLNIQPTSKICDGTDFYGALETSITKFNKAITGRKGVVVLTDGMQNSFPVRNMVVEGQSIRRVSDSTDDKDFQRTLRTVSRSDVVFYFLAVNTDLNPDEIGAGPGQRSRNGVSTYNPALIYNMQQARSRMQQLAESAGGRVVYPKTPADVAPLYEEIARDFGTNYGLWYSPKRPGDLNDSKVHRIEVKVKTPGLTVRPNRDSYTSTTR